MTQSTVADQSRWSSWLGRLANNEMLVAYLFILPSLVGFVLFYAYPAVRAVGISFTEWNLLSDAEFVGLANYQDIFSDDRFWASLENTLWYVLWNIPIQTVIAIFMAIMLEKFSNMVSTVMRSVMILPWLTVYQTLFLPAWMVQRVFCGMREISRSVIRNWIFRQEHGQ